jgi:polar amino acid transport system substrate-binding protein
MRFGVVAGLERTEFFVVKNADGQPEGVPVDLARELARRLGVPVEFKVASSPLELTEMLLGGKIDSAVMPPDRWGRQRLDFGTFYFVDRESYLVPRGSRLKTIDEVDNRRVRVIAIEGTTTDRAAARRLKNTTVNPVDSVEGALEMLRTGQADALALTYGSLAPLVERVPGSRILEGSFESVGLAFAVPKNRPYALDYVAIFTESAKASGLVQRAFDNAGLRNSPPAKPDSTAPVFWSFAPSGTRWENLALLGDAPDLLSALCGGAHDRGFGRCQQLSITHDRLAVDHHERDVACVALPHDVLDRVPHRLKVGLPEVEDEQVGLGPGFDASEVGTAQGVGAVQGAGADQLMRGAEVALAEVLLR